MPPADPRLSPEQRALLLGVAREAILAHLGAGRVEALPTADSALNAPGAAFVTLRKRRSLRGCIGFLHAVKPLVEAVAHCAVSAATADPRFPPVRVEELPHLSLEISVLSPLTALPDPSALEVGRHGLFVSKDGRHGLLLPQVAVEYGWDRVTFLRQTCLKAGLPPEAWEQGADLQVFTVECFGDDRPLA
ncbi:MAG: AmmeMemoRadiSam system protein A [Candidatus Methylomirabilales bacterium]